MSRHLLVAVVALALAIRLALALSIDRPLVSDERDYDALAWTLASTGQYREQGHPTAYRPVGYPAFVAAVYAAVGRSPRAVRVAQSILDAGTALLLFVALRRRSRRAALAAAGLWAIFPPAIAYATLLYSETLFCFLLALAAAWLLDEPDRTVAWRLSLGALLGLLVLVKTTALLLVLFLPWFALRGGKRWRRAAVIAAGVLLVVVPWIVRNAVVVGSPQLATSSAANLLIGNHPNATGAYATNIPEAMLPRSTEEAVAARQASRAAWDYVAEHPGRFVARIPLRWAHLFMGEGELALSAFRPRSADPRTPYRDMVAELGAWRVLLFWIPYAFVLLAGAAGLLTRRWDPLTALLLALGAASLVAHGATFGGGRHHAAWMPLLAAFAAERLVGSTGARPLRGWRAVVWLGFASLCAVLWLVEGARYLG